MFKLATDCKDCVHADVCRYKDNAANSMKKLQDMKFDDNDAYHSWEGAMAAMRVTVTFSCGMYSCKPSINYR